VVRVPGYRSGGPGFDFRVLQEKKVVGLERGPLSRLSTTEELLGRPSSGFGPESLEYGRRNSSLWPRGTLYSQKKLALTSLTNGGRGRYSSLADWGHGVFLGAVQQERSKNGKLNEQWLAHDETQLAEVGLFAVSQNGRALVRFHCNGETIPVTGSGGPYVCETPILPHFLDSLLSDGDEIVSPTRRPPFIP
jgi:hypothetical protein